MIKKLRIPPSLQMWMMTLTILVSGTGIAAFINSIAAPNALTLASADCAILDHAASSRVAALVSDASLDGDLKLDEALVLLRRARKSCRAGNSVIARNDYEALSVLQPKTMNAGLNRD